MTTVKEQQIIDREVIFEDQFKNNDILSHQYEQIRDTYKLNTIENYSYYDNDMMELMDNINY